MDLQVAAVETVVVGDHHLRELDVLVVERLQYAVELLDDEVQPAECAFLELVQLLLEVGSSQTTAICGGARLRLRGAVVRAAERGLSSRYVSRTFRYISSVRESPGW